MEKLYANFRNLCVCVCLYRYIYYKNNKYFVLPFSKHSAPFSLTIYWSRHRVHHVRQYVTVKNVFKTVMRYTSTSMHLETTSLELQGPFSHIWGCFSEFRCFHFQVFIVLYWFCAIITLLVQLCDVFFMSSINYQNWLRQLKIIYQLQRLINVNQNLSTRPLTLVLCFRCTTTAWICGAWAAC